MSRKITGGTELIEQFIGKRIKIFVKEPQNYKYSGILISVSDIFLTLNDDRDKEMVFPISNISQIKLNEKVQKW